MSKLSDILAHTDFEHISLGDLVHLDDSLSQFENTTEKETLETLKKKITDKYAEFNDRFGVHEIRTGYAEKGWGKHPDSMSPEEITKQCTRNKKGWDSNDGWKFHLDVVPNRNHPVTKAVSEFLLDLGVRHKVADGGENGKGMTVYCGSYDDINKLAKVVQERFGKDIYEPPAYTDQVCQEHAFQPKVYGRFVPGSDIGNYPTDGIGIGHLGNNAAERGLYFQKTVSKAFELGVIKDVNVTVFPTAANHRTRAKAFNAERESVYLLSYCSHRLYAEALGSYYCGTNIDEFEKNFFKDKLPAKGTAERKKWDEVAKTFVAEAKTLSFRNENLFDHIKNFSNGYIPIDFSRLPPEHTENKDKTAAQGNQPRKTNELSSQELFVLYNNIAEKTATKEKSGKEALKVLQKAIKSPNNNGISLDYFYSAAQQVIKSDPSLQPQVMALALSAWDKKENDQMSLRAAITFFGENRLTVEQTKQVLDKLPAMLDLPINTPKTREYAFWLMREKLFPKGQSNPDISKEDYKKSFSLLEREIKKENSEFGLGSIRGITSLAFDNFPEFNEQLSRLDKNIESAVPTANELGSLSGTTIEAGKNRLKEINKSISSATGDDLGYYAAEIDVILRNNPQLTMEASSLLNKMAASDKHNNLSLHCLADTLITAVNKEPKLLAPVEKNMLKIIQAENLSEQSLFQIYGRLSEMPSLNRNASSFVLNVVSAGLESNKNTADAHANAVAAITNSIVHAGESSLSQGLPLLEKISRSDKQNDISVKSLRDITTFVAQKYPQADKQVQQISDNISRQQQEKITAEEHISAPTPEENAAAPKNQDFKKPWREFYQKVAAKEKSEYSEDKDSAHYKATLSRTNGEKLEITATPQNKVSLAAKDKDGKNKVPSYEDFNNLVLAAKEQGRRISFGKIKTPEFRARLMLACLENGVEIKELPEFSSMAGLEAETKQRLTKHKAAILKRMLTDKAKNGEYSGLSSEEKMQRQKLEKARQVVRNGRKNNQTDTPEYKTARNMLIQRQLSMKAKS